MNHFVRKLIEINHKNPYKKKVHNGPLRNIIFCNSCLFISPIYGSLSDTKDRKLPIILTISNAIITGLIITIESVYQGTKTCLSLYILANIVNGFGGGSLILIS